jgi:hypothetical protein
MSSLPSPSTPPPTGVDRRRFLTASAVAVAGALTLGLTDTGPARADTNAWAKGLDSNANPNPAEVARAGYTFISYYLAGPGIMTAAKVAACVANGVAVIANWEWYADPTPRGYAGGATDAQQALATAQSSGIPADRPIYFSIDFDVQPSQYAAVDAYLDGIASVLPRNRIGVYSSTWCIDHLAANGKATWFWQSMSSGFSGGQNGTLNAHTHIWQRGYYTTPSGVSCDWDYAITADYGQWGIRPAPADPFRVTSSIAAMRDGSTQVLAMSQDDTLWHTTLSASGTWSGWTTVAGGNGTPFVAKYAAVAAVPDGSGSSQILAVGTDSVVYHNIRYANGTWQGFQPLTGGNGTAWKTSTAPSITGLPDGSSQILVTATDGTLYHNTRTPTAWTGWSTIAGGNGTPFVTKGATIAGTPDGSGSSQVLAVATDGTVYHNIRYANGTWQGFQPLTGGNGTAWKTSTTPSITGLPNGSSQILVTSTDGTLYHNTRTPTAWTGWTTIPGGNGTPFVAHTDSLSAPADNSGTSQILASGTNDVLYRNVRAANGTWQGFQPLLGGNGAPWLTA